MVVSGDIHHGISAFVHFHMQNDFPKRMFSAHDRDTQQMRRWLDFLFLQSTVSFLLLSGSSVF